MSDKEAGADKIQALASQCVKCGLCLPHCPTYRLSENENESPRGRIELLQALSTSKLPLTEKVAQHLDQCLSCRHCERVCPADVAYEKLISTGRTWLQSQSPSYASLVKMSWKTRALISMATHPFRIRWVGRLLRFLQISGARRIARLIGLTSLLGLTRHEKLLPKVPSQKKFKKCYSPNEPPKDRVGLFLGCLSRWCDRTTPNAALFVLQACGTQVEVPRDQGCCGAMAYHQGDEKKGLNLAKMQKKIFMDTKIATIITTASGCGAMLIDALDGTVDTRMAMNTHIQDISDYVLAKRPSLTLSPLKKRVALHTPCTLKNGMKQHDATLTLLNSIPLLEVFPIAERSACCGSAGTYMLEHAQWADKLVQKILNEVENAQLDFIATSNIGCALHLQKAIHDRKMTIKVLHPIVLVAYSLGWQS